MTTSVCITTDEFKNIPFAFDHWSIIYDTAECGADSRNSERGLQALVDSKHHCRRKTADDPLHVRLRNRVETLAAYGRVREETRCRTVGSREIEQELMGLVSVRQIRRDRCDDSFTDHAVETIALDNESGAELRSRSPHKRDLHENDIAARHGFVE